MYSRGQKRGGRTYFCWFKLAASHFKSVASNPWIISSHNSQSSALSLFIVAFSIIVFPEATVISHMWWFFCSFVWFDFEMRQENRHLMILIWLHDRFIKDCNAFYAIFLSVAIRESCVSYFSPQHIQGLEIHGVQEYHHNNAQWALVFLHLDWTSTLTTTTEERWKLCLK